MAYVATRQRPVTWDILPGSAIDSSSRPTAARDFLREHGTTGAALRIVSTRSRSTHPLVWRNTGSPQSLW
jgi:hypothetical protein